VEDGRNESSGRTFGAALCIPALLIALVATASGGWGSGWRCGANRGDIKSNNHTKDLFVNGAVAVGCFADNFTAEI